MSDTRKSSIRFILVTATILLLAAAGVSAQERWFHVKVTEGGDNSANVTVNLPLTLIETALKLVPDEVNEEMKVEFSEAGIDIDDLRDFWREMRETEDATFVTVESDDATVRVAKEGDFLVAKTVESGDDGAQVDVRFPFTVIEALFNEDTDELDLSAAIRALAEYTDGDIVTVKDGDTSVRVWVDDKNESSG